MRNKKAEFFKNSSENVDFQKRYAFKAVASVAATLTGGSLANLLMGSHLAHAADYKALVCIFLYGGNDGLNTIVPTNALQYNAYSLVRGPLAIPREKLIPIKNTQFGLHPSLSSLSGAIGRGIVAPVLNVGPLKSVLNKTQYRNSSPGSKTVPMNLFSHSDQQILWETSSTDVQEKTGWGGRASESLNTTNPVISLGGSSRFGMSGMRSTLVIPGPGSTFGAWSLQPSDLSWPPLAKRKQAIDAMYASNQNNDLGDAYRKIQNDAFSISARLSSLIPKRPGEDSQFSAIDSAFSSVFAGGNFSSDLAKQLYQIAKMIASNSTLQGNRQIFFAELGGFDTHSSQVADHDPLKGVHADLLKQLGDAISAFETAMMNLGMSDKVTSFTQSDFGRTFKPNNSYGTDHAWGNHHLVIGGAVKGDRTYGTPPELLLGGPDDVGVDAWELQGRWIPTTSVDQYASTLLNWFGVPASQISKVLPNIESFSNKSLGFL